MSQTEFVELCKHSWELLERMRNRPWKTAGTALAGDPGARFDARELLRALVTLATRLATAGNEPPVGPSDVEPLLPNLDSALLLVKRLLGWAAQLADQDQRRKEGLAAALERFQQQQQADQAGAEPADQTEGEKVPAPAGDKQAAPVGKLAKAIGVLSQHPDWSDRRIAKEVGCTGTYLSNQPKWRAARKAIKGIGQEVQHQADRHLGHDMDQYQADGAGDQSRPVLKCESCGDPAGMDAAGRPLIHDGKPRCLDCWTELTGG